MTDMIPQTVGVDISKDTLDVHVFPAGLTRRLANTAKGFAGLIAWLKDFSVTRIVFEPTGTYHRAFERRLAEAGLPLVKINPRQAQPSPRRSARMPRRTGSMRPCSPVSARCSSRRSGPP